MNKVLNLPLLDSQLGGCSRNLKNCAIVLRAIDELKSQVELNQVEFISLRSSYGSDSDNQLDNPPVWYEVSEVDSFHSDYIIKSANFFTSHYIGNFSTVVNGQPVQIAIKPRFGEALFNYLLSYAYGIHLPKGASSFEKKHDYNSLLLAQLWKVMTGHAITKSHIPKEYVSNSRNLRTFKGRLNVKQHIKTNIINQTRFHCSYRTLTPDVLINQVIRFTYNILKRKGYKGVVKDLAGYDKKLETLGVGNSSVEPSDVNRIRYSRLNKHYEPAMKLSKAIIKNHGGVDQKPLSSNNSFSYLIDVATLWEDYITSLLRKHLKDFSVEAPNQSSTSYPLLSNGKREIRPDNLIKDNRSRVVAVIDAKYKMEREIGSTEKNGISREDLHQMITYLHHFGQNTPGLIGLFVTPTKNLSHSDQPELEHLSSSGHKVGVVNCNLQQFDQYDPVPKEDIKKEEKSFADKVRKCLENS